MNVALPTELESRLEGLGTAEDISSIASALIALANEQSHLDSWDFAVPLIDDLYEETLWTLMRSGRARVAQHEIAKKISLFGYGLVEIRKGVQHRTYYLVSPSRPF